MKSKNGTSSRVDRELRQLRHGISQSFVKLRDAPLDSTTAPRWSVRTLLLAAALFFLIPAIIGIVALSFYRYGQGYAQLQASTQLTARNMSVIVDAYLDRTMVIAQSLASSRRLQNRDFSGFHQQAVELLSQTGVGSIVVLNDRAGQQLVNTARPFGEPLPRSTRFEQLRETFDSGKPLISDMFIGALTGKSLISIDVPVIYDGRVGYVVSVTTSPQQLHRVLTSREIPADWEISVLDKSGAVAARSQGTVVQAGGKGAPELLARILAKAEDVLETTTDGGVPALSAYSRSPGTGWTVTIEVPREALQAPLIRNIAFTALEIAGLLGLGVGMVWFAGNRIAQSVQALTGQANALLAGEVPVVPKVCFREAHDVAQAMTSTAQTLAQRTAERESAESASRSSDAAHQTGLSFTSTLLDQLPIGVSMRSLQGDFIDANRAFADIIGYPHDQLLGVNIDRITPPEYAALDASQLQDLRNTGSYGPYEKEYIRPDGSRLPVSIRGLRVRRGDEDVLLSVTEDISLRRQSEFQLAQSQKMDAIGQLTGGLAHDFNNMLGVIIGNLDLLAVSLAGNDPAQAKLAHALEASLRGADLTRALLSVARAQAISSEPVDLNTRLNELLPLIRHTAGSNIEVAMALSDVPTVQVDPSGLASTVLNLVINARDAMPMGGQLTVAVELRQLAAQDGHGHLAPGRYVVLSVADNGTGMSPAVMAQALTPFFTTKERGRGTGLGLAMAHGFVKQCAGDLQLRSKPGVGTTVSLFLPVASQPASGVNQTAVKPTETMPMPRGTEHVLIVDDEIELLAVTAFWLDDLGYAVTSCKTATSALAAIEGEKNAGRPYALMVTDVIMPGMSGFGLAKLALAIQPDLTLLYISGYADAMDPDRERPPGGLLEKPFRQAELAAQVHKALNESRTEAI
jgi:PAS domain S-box-containing protein